MKVPVEKWSRLDEQLADFSPYASLDSPVFGCHELVQHQLASGLADDLTRILNYARAEWPSFREELEDPITLQQRRDALDGYFHLMQMGDSDNPILQRSRIIAQFYFDIIYFREQILWRLKAMIGTPGKFGHVPYAASWLELAGEGDLAKKLKSLRNGFAHGKWAYLQDYSGIVCYPEQTRPYTQIVIRQEELGTVHALMYSFQVVFFTVAQELGFY
jgi:hypothetical protein